MDLNYAIYTEWRKAVKENHKDFEGFDRYKVKGRIRVIISLIFLIVLLIAGLFVINVINILATVFLLLAFIMLLINSELDQADQEKYKKADERECRNKLRIVSIVLRKYGICNENKLKLLIGTYQDKMNEKKVTERFMYGLVIPSISVFISVVSLFSGTLGAVDILLFLKFAALSMLIFFVPYKIYCMINIYNYDYRYLVRDLNNILPMTDYIK